MAGKNEKFMILECMFVLLLEFSLASLIPFEFTGGDIFIDEVKRCLETEINFKPINTTEARLHFEFLRNVTREYWTVKRPPYRDCYGPFLENEFIRRYGHKPLSFFPMIPIFMPWFALWKFSNGGQKYHSIVKSILSELRSDYLYFTISESDYGFTGGGPGNGYLPSNVLVFSTSGMGHVAIPWLQGNIRPPKKRKIDHLVSFCGNPRSSIQRKEILEVARASFGSDMFEYRGSDWARVSANSIFGFSPRGIAVGTYRTSELIRLETIPIIATDKIHWLPYHPILNWSEFAILTDVNEMPRTASIVRTLAPDDLVLMRKRLHEVHSEYFSWSGVFRRLEMFWNRTRSGFTCSKATLTL